MRPPIPRLSPSRASALLFAVMLLIAAPLMSGCLERSTTVGDRFAGSVIVATTPDNPGGAPQFDIPESMRGNIAVSEYRQHTPSESSAAPSSVPPGAGSGNSNQGLIGSRATFSNLTTGQLGQLGDIVADAFGDTSMTMELGAKRSGEVVRLTGSADLNGLIPRRDYLKFTISFAGPISATNGDQNTDTSVSWTPEPGKPANFTAEATYADPSTAAFGGWTWLMILICAAVVLVVIRLAYVSRDRRPRPGRPVDGSPGAGKSSGNGLRGLFGRGAGSSKTTGKSSAGPSGATGSVDADKATATSASESHPVPPAGGPNKS
ncbi:LppM family (lipo)protein [Gordonia sp. DT30]|uniref:LppM family (lipo)protein n=1 Tax=unclassified Gordonia (in: high G+C Gram-positive bacteria) TaxID=2657482 RepID=UPI003CF2EDCC